MSEAPLKQDARTVRKGPKVRKVQQTFVLYPDQYRLVDKLKAFRRIVTILAEHLPALQEGDILETFGATSGYDGPIQVIEFYHLTMGNGEPKSVIAARFIDEGEAQTANMEAENG
jgi:hypothetical protein